MEFYNRNWRVPNSFNGTEDNNNKVSNYSLSFDGNEYVIIGSSTDIDNVPSNPYSFSFWFKSSTAGRVLSEKKASTTGLFNAQYAIHLESGKITWYGGAGDSNNGRPATYTSTTLTDDEWHHIVCVAESTTVNKIYVDGQLDVTSSVNRINSAVVAGTFNIGANYGGSYRFIGGLDQVAIFDYALTDGTGGTTNQIAELYGSSSTGVGNPMAITNGRKPVAYYPLGDHSAYNGTEYLVANSALSDYVFDFEGNDNISISNASNIFDFGTNDFTISLWCKGDGVAANQYLIGSTDNSFRIGRHSSSPSSGNGGARFRIGSSSNTITGVTTNIDDGNWHNVIVKRESGGVSIFTDGQAQQLRLDNGSDVSTPYTMNDSITVGSNLFIGAYNSNAEYWIGEISNVAIFNTALPATGTESVQSLYNYGTPPDISSYSGLQGFWKLDAGSTFDGSNWTVPDESSNLNNGTSSGMSAANLVQSNLNILSPYSRYALNFDGSNDYVDCGDSDSFSFGNGSTDSAFSVSSWCYIDNLSNFIVFTKGVYSSTGEWHLRMTGANQMHLVLYDGLDFEACIINETLNTNQWYHFAFTYDGRGGSTANDGILGYLNGSLATLNRVDSGSYAAMTNSSASLYIAKNGSNYSNGSISNPSIWNAALTSAQVTEIYNEGKPSNLNNHSAYSNLVSWWQLGENSSFNSNWTVLDEKGTNNGTSVNMAEDDLVDGVGTTANGLSSGMGGADNILGEAPFSNSNALSYGMGADAKSTSVPT